MNILSPIELFAGILISLIVAMVIMLWLQMRSSMQISKLTFPAYEYVIKKAEHEANGILNDAQKEAREIIADAQKAGQKTFAQYEESAQKAHDTYIGTIESFSKELTGQLAASAQNGATHLESLTAAALESIQKDQSILTSQFKGALATVEKTSELLETHTARAISHMEDHIKEVTKALALKLSHEEKDQKSQIALHLQKAQKAAEEQIAEYQKSRVAILDTHIERLVEDVTKRVLNKQLTLDEHAELARIALTEAKTHNLL